MQVVHEVTIYELVIPYVTTVITFITAYLYSFLNTNISNKRYLAMLKVVICMFVFNLFYLLMILFLRYDHMKMAGNMYAISQMALTFLMPYSICYVICVSDIYNEKMLFAMKLIAKILFIIGIASIPFSLASANFDLAILHWGTREMPGDYATNLPRLAVPEIYFTLRNVLYLPLGFGSVAVGMYYCVKKNAGFAEKLLVLSFLVPMFGSILEFYMYIGRVFLLPEEAHFSRIAVSTILFAMIAFLSSISMFAEEHMKIDVLRGKLAIVNIQNNATVEQVNTSKNTFVQMQDTLSSFVHNLKAGSKSIHSACQFSIFYTNSLLEANEYFSQIDEERRGLYQDSRRKIDSLYSSFEVLKKAVVGQAGTLDSIINEISDSSDILINVEGRIEHLNKMSNDLVESYSRVRQSMLGSFKRLDSIVEAAGMVRKSIMFIKDISEKTNLLSINANIQASKSSGWGNNFGFVATEIADLALDSRIAADRIDELFLMVTKTTNEFIATKNYIVEVFDSIIENIFGTMNRIKHISNIVSSQISDNKTIKQNTQFAKELNNSIALEIETRYDEIYEVIQRFEALDEQFEFFREQLLVQTNEIAKLAKDMDDLIDLSKELNIVSQDITTDISSIEGEIKSLPSA